MKRVREMHVIHTLCCVICESCVRDICLLACLSRYERPKRVVLPAGSRSKFGLDTVCSDAGTVSVCCALVDP